MKKLRYIILTTALGLFVLSGCEKEETGLTVSRVTTYPLLELLGDEFLTVLVGSNFTDPGVNATIGGEPVQVEMSGSVDTNTPGVYILSYSARNEDGFEASARRWVGVITPEAAADDLSGDYRRIRYTTNVPAGIATWRKVGDGLYTNNNIGGVEGSPEFIYEVYVFNVEKNKIMVPVQPNPLGGNLYAASTEGAPAPDLIDFVPGGPGTESYTWSVIGTRYGTPLRTFAKQ